MLEKMAGARPGDPFPQYGLAMEYRKLGQHAQARAAFDRLLQAHPDYVPSYLMYGQMLSAQGEPAEARAILQRGIEAARRAGDAHAEGELEQALGELGTG